MGTRSIARQKAPLMAFETHKIEVNGATLSFRRGGSGPPLLFLHGADGLTDWPVILDDLAVIHDVIALDLPGFDNSAIPDWVDDISDAAYFCLEFLEKLALRQVRIVGHSLGAWVAIEMAIRSAERIESLVIISAAGIHVKGSPKTDIYMIDPEEQARLAYADPELGEAAAQRALEGKYQENAILNRIASARFGWNPRLYNPRLERWLCRLRVPTLIVWGLNDRIIPARYAEAFQKVIPNAKVKLIENAGHLPHVERREEVLAAIQDHFS